MQLSRLLFRLTWLLLPLALASTTWLYLYPLFHGCAFPQPNNTSLPLHAARAPFRLLALGDPQLEGDSSLPDPRAPVFPSLQYVLTDLRYANYDLSDARDILAAAAKGAVKDAAAWLEGWRKTVDLWGNDLYLAHIVRSLRWWTEPTHVAVLGDLLGSQWISDGEFEKRAGRYWGTVMRGLEKVPDETMGVWVENDHYDEPEEEREGKRTWGGTTEVLGEDKEWEKRVINIAGNHDIGYAGDIDEARVERFERAFGSVNWDMWLTLPLQNNSSATSDSTDSTSTDNTQPPALRLVVLNTMNLDTPAYTPSLQADTYTFLNHLISTSRPVTDKSHATILLTHIPLHKPAGICADAPYFDFFDGGSGVREQNMLSEHGSKSLLEGVFGLNRDANAEGAGLGRRGVLVNGHDHVGCDVVHWISQPSALHVCHADADAIAGANATENLPRDVGDGVVANDTSTDAEKDPDLKGWQTSLFPPNPHHLSSDGKCTHIPSSPHLREITLRSMMGDYHGSAGFLSAWYDAEKGEKGEWVVEFGSCRLGVQHWWWGVHVLDLILVVALIAGWVARGVEYVGGVRRGDVKGGKGSKREEKEGKEGKEGKERKREVEVVKPKVVKEKARVVELSVGPGARRMQDTRRV